MTQYQRLGSAAPRIRRRSAADPPRIGIAPVDAAPRIRRRSAADPPRIGAAPVDAAPRLRSGRAGGWPAEKEKEEERQKGSHWEVMELVRLMS